MSYPYAQRGTVNFNWISEAWQLFMANAGTWALSALIAGLVTIGVSTAIRFATGGFNVTPTAAPTDGFWPAFMNSFMSTYERPTTWLSSIVTAFVGAFFYSGMLRMANAQVRGEAIEIGMLFQGAQTYIPVLLIHILNSVAFALCFLPGVILYPFIFPGYAVAANGDSIGDSLSKSFDAMKSNWLSGFAFIFVLGFITLLSVIPCGLGLLATYPMMFICMSLAYRDLIGMPGAQDTGSTGFNQFDGAQPGQWPPPPGQIYGGQQGYPPQQPSQPGQPATPYARYTNQPLGGTPPQSVYDAPALAHEPESNIGELPADDTIDESGETPRAE